MNWCWNLLFGVFFNVFKTSMSSEAWLVFPGACLDEASDVISLNNKEDMEIRVISFRRSWINVIYSDSYRRRCEGQSCSKTSAICQKTFDMSGVKRRNTKLYINIKLEHSIHYYCPFTYLLYSGNSIQPVKVIHCWEEFNQTLHWPDTNLTLAIKINLLRVSNATNDTKILIRAGTCRKCFQMEIPERGNVELEKWQVNLPVECATRACLEYKPFLYTIQAFSGVYINRHSKAPCYVTFDIMGDRDESMRVTTCLQMISKKYGVLPYDNKLLLVLKIDNVTYMEFTNAGLDDYWCLPDHWMKQKSSLTLQWKGGNFVCDSEPWTLHVKTNITWYKYYSSCKRNPYQEKNITYVSQDRGDDPVTVDRYTEVLQSSILPAALCTLFVTVISIVVIVCVIRRRRSRATRSTNQNVRQMSTQRRPPSTADNNASYGLTQLDEVTPVLPTAPPLNDTDQVSTNQDPPPPYPGEEMAPPSYDEVCQFLPTQPQNVKT